MAIINIIQMCDRFHTFPKAGGLFDQDSLFVNILHNYFVWENERRELDEHKRSSSASASRQ